MDTLLKGLHLQQVLQKNKKTRRIILLSGTEMLLSVFEVAILYTKDNEYGVILFHELSTFCCGQAIDKDLYLNYRTFTGISFERESRVTIKLGLTDSHLEYNCRALS